MLHNFYSYPAITQHSTALLMSSPGQPSTGHIPRIFTRFLSERFNGGGTRFSAASREQQLTAHGIHRQEMWERTRTTQTNRPGIEYSSNYHHHNHHRDRHETQKTMYLLAGLVIMVLVIRTKF